MYLYRLFDTTPEFSQRGGIAVAIIAAESEQAARETVIIDTERGENEQLTSENYACQLLGFCSTVEAGVLCVDHDYDYLRVEYAWHKQT